MIYDMVHPYLIKTSHLSSDLQLCLIISLRVTPYTKIQCLLNWKINYLRKPSVADLRTVANEFEALDLPHCFGVIDEKHCHVRKPKHSGSAYYNYKKFFNINLLAICNYNKRFLMINLGGYGSVNDAFTFNNSDIYEGLENGEISLPQPELIPGSNVFSPYFLIGNGGFPLKHYLLKPYMQVNNITPNMQIFN
ncbi:hypothetical protein TKK_0017125 [Trichogramma kaykai]